MAKIRRADQSGNTCADLTPDRLRVGGRFGGKGGLSGQGFGASETKSYGCPIGF
ncbi:MAG: hypothetical protein SPJ97_03645 [Bacteroides sp.]|nr:hypothetical protein [Bacteroides sp.]